MDVTVRRIGAEDRAAWAAMRAALWPEDSLAGDARMADELLRDGDFFALIAEAADGTAIGFAEIAVRKYANGCESQPVPFLEGIWVTPEARRCGVGAQLLARAEALLAARGFHELGSDTPIDNGGSQAAHRAWGFSETERVVYFRKPLGDARGEVREPDGSSHGV
jgi:aminoglycoside 6'-N-acetyltransferase I